MARRIRCGSQANLAPFEGCDAKDPAVGSLKRPQEIGSTRNSFVMKVVKRYLQKGETAIDSELKIFLFLDRISFKIL